MPSLPEHIAIVMDGNGRWAEKRKRPRTMGHQAGLRTLRRTVEHCVRRGIRTLTVFAFSSENWDRPQREVSRLMDLFMRALDKEVGELHENDVRVCFIGERDAFTPELHENMNRAENLTRNNRKMTLNVAANYGGRWDILQAARKLARAAARGEIDPDAIDKEAFEAALTTSHSTEPDLFIRTGGEMRISNFLLWQSAYTEFYFTPVLWPDFNAEELDRAIAAYGDRERRFGKTGSQVRGRASA
ncbi:MAG: isoprenyl transferase [Xanthomonadales bacterium]|nr:isoprenyl transferase [Xanthomonadales bacterium]NIX13103.1 isoprenyl transferase [Xanthomonadales bacterium]